MFIVPTGIRGVSRGRDAVRGAIGRAVRGAFGQRAWLRAEPFVRPLVTSPLRFLVRLIATSLVALVPLVGAACGSGASGPFVWGRDYKPEAAPVVGYQIGIGDMISVDVYKTPEMTTKARVRPDGMFAVALLGDIRAAGKAPAVLAKDLETALKDRGLVNDPRVTVNVDEPRTLTISVLGKVMRPGVFNLAPGAGIAEALANAGGLSEFAHRDAIFLSSSDPQIPRRRFTFEELIGAAPPASSTLRTGDVVYVY